MKTRTYYRLMNEKKCQLKVGDIIPYKEKPKHGISLIMIIYLVMLLAIVAFW